MDSLSNDELKALLEALHIALRVTVVFPPLENSRIYTEIDKLWERFGNEAIARGLTEYAEYYPEMDGVQIGNALDNGSDAEDAIEFHDDDRFWHTLEGTVIEGAIQQAYGMAFYEMPTEQQAAIRSEMNRRVTDTLETTGISSILNLEAITKH